MGSFGEKIQNSLQEARILVLATEILLGFEYRSCFEPGFAMLPGHSQHLMLAALLLILLTSGLVMAPAMYHRIATRGEDTKELYNWTSTMLLIALVPFSVVIGINFFVVTEKIAGKVAGTVLASLSCFSALFLWYGLQTFERKSLGKKTLTPKMHLTHKIGPTPLSSKINHVLTETRVMLPGVQALLGFQLATTLSSGFDQLNFPLKFLHLLCLGLLTSSMILLMSPAAYHRLVDEGEETERFHNFSSKVIVISAVPLGLALSGDIYIVFAKVTQNKTLAEFACGAAIVFFAALWFALPTWKRRNGQ